MKYDFDEINLPMVGSNSYNASIFIKNTFTLYKLNETIIDIPSQKR